MAWFDKPQNVLQFRDIYNIGFSHRLLKPQFLLVYGRRAEANRTALLENKRVSMQRLNEVLMTYDRLAPAYDARCYPCVRIDANGYRAITIPPTFTLGPIHADEMAIIREKKAATQASPYLSTARRDFLASRFPYWDDWSWSAVGIERGIIRSRDQE